MLETEMERPPAPYRKGERLLLRGADGTAVPAEYCGAGKVGLVWVRLGESRVCVPGVCVEREGADG